MSTCFSKVKEKIITHMMKKQITILDNFICVTAMLHYIISSSVTILTYTKGLLNSGMLPDQEFNSIKTPGS